jgi:hypothetical protein
MADKTLTELLKYIKNPYNRLDEIKFNETCLVYLYNYSTSPGTGVGKEEIIQAIHEINATDPTVVLKRVQQALFPSGI